jgi:alpha-tubulin suppressor-like RCC1 family protein
MARMVGKLSENFGSRDNGIYGYPQFVDSLKNVVSTHCSAGLTVSLTIDGEVWSFGQNRWGQCGVDDAVSIHIYDPKRVELPKIKSVDTGLQHCVAVSESGKEVYTWGKGTRGQLGIGEKETFPMPKRVENFDGIIVACSAGFNHTALITSGGVLYVWGKNMSQNIKKETKNGRFPMVIFEDQLVPRCIDMPEGRKVKEIHSR